MSRLVTDGWSCAALRKNMYNFWYIETKKNPLTSNLPACRLYRRGLARYIMNLDRQEWNKIPSLIELTTSTIRNLAKLRDIYIIHTAYKT